MKTNRNAYLIWKSLRNFVLASVLTATAAQLASTFDAVILAQFEGEEAMSALSLVLPVTTFINCVGLLLAFGANALVARAIGRHDLEGASAIFSAAVCSILTIGVGFSVLLFLSIPLIMRLITDEPVLRELPVEYLRVYALGAWLEMLSYALCLFVATDGHPRRVTVAVYMGMLANIAVDILAVGYFEWGVGGVACGTLCQFVTNILALALYFRQPSCSYRLVWPVRRWRLLKKNMEEGAPVTISNILMSVTVLLIGNTCFDALGERGFFFWSVCLQMLLVSVVFVNGVMEALFAIGGVLQGEHDLEGLHLLVRRALITVGVLVCVQIAVMCVPDAVGILFGVEEASVMADLNHAVSIFSWMLLPFALTLILVAVYQVLELELLSIVCVVGQLAALIAIVWTISIVSPGNVWFGFPLATFLFLALQLLYSYARSRRQGCRVSGLTLIPYSEGGHALDLSLRYQQDEVITALQQIRAFLKDSGVDKSTAFSLEVSCEELMMNIVEHSTGRVVNHSFDIHAYADHQKVRIAIKDAGRPFDPISLGKKVGLPISDHNTLNLGVRIAANLVEDISYKYMYGQNSVLIKA